MIPKRFADIEKSDIDALLENAVSESRTLDYKEKLPGNSSEDRKEFLADVISFANASGGDLVFGVSEQRDAENKLTGLPGSILGLAGINADNEILRLESMLRDNIEPRLPSVRMCGIPGFTEGPVIIIRVEQSWTAPHRSKQDRHFYSRTSAGKYQMDVGEIRSAFALSSNLADSIRQFRDGRLARIVADEIPVPFGIGAWMVLHLIPQSSVLPSTVINLQPFVQNNSDRQLLRPMRYDSWNSRYNYEGYCTSNTLSYTQLFRSGAIEFALGNLASDEQGTLAIPAAVATGELLYSVELGLNALHKLDVSLPIFALISFVDVINHKLAIHQQWMNTYPIDRNVLMLPDIMISDWDTEPHRLLQPTFDALWQTVGFPKCTYYDHDGSWIGPTYYR